ncbi:GNAT family N-acetyltransferase [Sporolactobacillus terrae]|uniref:N-acetyltransferase n=1 Tax=Sporolactobacillus terrae TaxID=269673 RepID=A0A410D6R0_9BACL|nr:GNAT family N-acetyltransferase [Sporolactobacillus terrae]QAA21788.1 N-acetyltransferase [Sporolactobacillus terrae]QAA24761.1 N-acetyltransferase [Sporolactobacillus terrae]UAK16587.1 GNAT family N-acetyltransferase [Sporolactobacillus terrae]BBN98069.1 N-acetyltransferase [Sporolactobacillus terrae]
MKKFSTERPSSSDFYHLYQTTGWNADLTYGKEQLNQAIRNSWYTLSVYEDEQLIGFGRIISDGVCQAFLCDLIVLPEQRNNGIGSELVERLLAHCKAQGMRWVQLSCAKGKQTFYERFGFRARPHDAPGMQRFLDQ